MLLLKLFVKMVLESEVAQSCLTLCHPKDCSLPGSSVRGILQARVLEWVARPSSGGSSLQPGIEPESPVSPGLQADSLQLSHQGSPQGYNMSHLSESV